MTDMSKSLLCISFTASKAGKVSRSEDIILMPLSECWCEVVFGFVSEIPCFLLSRFSALKLFHTCCLNSGTDWRPTRYFRHRFLCKCTPPVLIRHGLNTSGECSWAVTTHSSCLHYIDWPVSRFVCFTPSKAFQALLHSRLSSVGPAAGIVAVEKNRVFFTRLEWHSDSPDRAACSRTTTLATSQRRKCKQIRTY